MTTTHQRSAHGWARIGLALALCLACLAGALATWQWIAFRQEEARLRPPAAWAKAGRFSLYYHCEGTGQPVVLLEAAFTAAAAEWAWVQPAVAAVTRVCAYDRAGLGWSEESGQPHDAQHIARQLATLLRQAGIAGPYVVVGHSMGGLFIREYAGLYPGQVAGMVAIDPVAPGELEQLPASAAAGYYRLYRLTAVAPTLARLGMLRLYDPFLGKAAGLPPRSVTLFRHFFNSPRHLAAMHAELQQWYATGQEVSRSSIRPDLPLTVIGAGKTERTNPAVAGVQAKMQRQFTARSRCGRYLLLPAAGHAGLVTDARQAQQVSRIIIRLVQQLRAARSGQGRCGR